MDELLAGVAADAVRGPPEPQLHAGPDVSAGVAVPPVDTTFRATAAHDVLMKGRGRSLAMRALRGVAALLLAACIGGVAMAWQYHAEAAQRIIAEWTPLFVQKSSQAQEKTGLPAPAVVAAAEVDPANAPAQAAPAAEAAAPPVAAAATPPAAVAPDEPQSLEAMARDLASAAQQIEQLKASVEQLKASQQQLVAMISEKAAAQNLRPKKPVQPAQAAQPPRPVAALTPARPIVPGSPPRPLRPPPPIAASAAAAPLPPAAPYVPRQVERPHAATETLDDPELVTVPRPPMPLR
jgi:hypothetical protein